MLQELDRARREYEDVSQRYTRSRKELQAMKVLADENAPLVDDKGEDLPLKDQLEDLPVESAEECKAAIEEADAKWKSIESDERVFNMYEQKMAELTHIEEELENLTSSRGKRITEMQQNLAPWEQELDVTIASIDKKFGGYMRELGCTGEVALTKAEPQENEENGSFKDWGIEIRVSFREGVKPSVLSARVQSGGERSVSTIMYLMALQERMVCPFRCVDEINQGLDERNERLVFKRIVENSCQPPGRKGTTDHCGQYFLITPKLLPNLFDMEVEAMTVQCIFNGAYNLKHASDWDVDKLIALRERRTIENEADGDQENSPNIMSENESPKKRRKVNA
jgi:chromosome segregation ATPase